VFLPQPLLLAVPHPLSTPGPSRNHAAASSPRLARRPNNTLLALGANNGSLTGDGTNHGELNAIRRAVDTLAARGLSPDEVRAALQTCSLYTNGEPCPMCASAVRWSGFRELIYGTSIETLVEYGAGQILISSQEVFEKSFALGGATSLIPGILSESASRLSVCPAAEC